MRLKTWIRLVAVLVLVLAVSALQPPASAARNGCDNAWGQDTCAYYDCWMTCYDWCANYAGPYDPSCWMVDNVYCSHRGGQSPPWDCNCTCR